MNHRYSVCVGGKLSFVIETQEEVSLDDVKKGFSELIKTIHELGKHSLKEGEKLELISVKEQVL